MFRLLNARLLQVMRSTDYAAPFISRRSALLRSTIYITKVGCDWCILILHCSAEWLIPQQPPVVLFSCCCVFISWASALQEFQKTKQEQGTVPRKKAMAEVKSAAVLPYIQGVSEPLHRCLEQQGIRTIFKSGTTLRSHLV